jgi:DNA-binding IscR family transcriptional regulator
MCNIRSLWGVLDEMMSAVLSRTSLADLLCFGRVQERFEKPRQMILAAEDLPSSIN